MKPSFFARPVRFFGSIAVLVLCVIFFLTPFALRGARMSLQRMENNVKDWLPDDFPETRELEWFGKHFVGERFVLATWPGCTTDDPRFDLMVEKLRGDLAPENSDQEIADAVAEAGDDSEQQALAAERVKARQLGDRHGLFFTGEYYENWGGLDEKWLQGDDSNWYYITPDGEIYRWEDEANLPGFLWRSSERLLRGTNEARGELIATVGEPKRSGTPNEYHSDPRKITARFFRTLTTGPDVVDRLTAEDGPLWPIGRNLSDEEKPLVARRQAYDRLTGVLFGPAVQSGFAWELEDFRAKLPDETLDQLPTDWESTYTEFVDQLIKNDYAGDRKLLACASSQQQTRHWDALFQRLQVPPPPRLTCLVLTLSEAGKRDLRRVIGRPLLGKPMGRLLALASKECNISQEEIKLGGPPVDNVAIDEEGTITLFRLIGYSAILGISLSWLCFRSIKITIMVFFVGGVSALASLSIVWWCGASVDAILMSMPSLVYVLGLSGAVHIVNYYREAVKMRGLAGAPERALSHGWGPCTLAAFTTALGLISLYTSNLAPIKKFGLFSAIGVIATLILLFTYLPAALQIFPPVHKREDEENARSFRFGDRVTSFWEMVGRWVVRRHGWVTAACVTVCLFFALGLPKLNTDVQLLKLFDSNAKIIRDYHWLENHMGKLVPMELVIRVAPNLQRPSLDTLQGADATARQDSRYQFSFLQRLELVNQVQNVVQSEFGEDGQNIVGQGMSAVTFAPDLPEPGGGIMDFTYRNTFNSILETHRQELLDEDYLRVDDVSPHAGSELWRVSLRLGALNDVDYGEFVHEQKLVVEPVLTAYRYYEQMRRTIDDESERTKPPARTLVGFLGSPKPADSPGRDNSESPVARAPITDASAVAAGTNREIDQSRIFTSTMKNLLASARFPSPHWHDPVANPLPEGFATSEEWGQRLSSMDCVVLVTDHASYDVDFIREHARVFIDARDHSFQLGTTPTAAERGDPVHVVYTGVVPVVYKAQRTLLNSLVNSIALAFVLIGLVMIILLRDWGSPLSLTNTVNVSAGLTSMLPNVFPVILVFGAMGHRGILVDIGTMMCASVAMGVAVDDTIHYLTWFRHGLRSGMSRNDAIVEAYRRVGTAMTQTTLIGGLGLAVFAFSTFTPTQRFGIMMVTILAAALVGDLIFLPALLAGPLGRAFCPKSRIQTPPIDDSDASSADTLEQSLENDSVTMTTAAEASSNATTPHSSSRASRTSAIRRDGGHRWPRT